MKGAFFWLVSGKKLILVFTLAVFIFGIPRIANAATPAIAGLSVSPASQDITVATTDSSVVFRTTVTNNTKAPVVVSVGARDFTSLNQFGAVDFFEDRPIGASSPHALAATLSLGLQQVALGVGESHVVPVTILNPNQLAAGGHYAAITFSLAGNNELSGNKITVNQVVTSLVFVKTSGEGTKTADLTNIILSSILTNMPTSVATVFRNQGNTQSIPRGFVQILDRSSKVLSHGIINPDSGLILPDSNRLFNIELPKVKKHIWPGIYKVRISYRADGQKDFKILERRVIYINKFILILTMVTLSLLILWIIWRIIPSSLYRLKKDK
jgi:hypothetical protein